MSKETVPYVVGSDTSEAAARSMVEDAGQLREFVFSNISKSRGAGMTCDEVEQETSMRHQTASARIRELAQKGRIVDSTRRRPTRSGRMAIVWIEAQDSTSTVVASTAGGVEAASLFPESVLDPRGEEGLAGLRRRCESCTKCVLSKSRNKVVFGEGNVNEPPICFVGEGPGGTEDDVGRPFVGPAGRFLDRIILAMKLKREQVYICNAVSCFVGGTIVDAASIHRGYRRWYEGPLVHVVTGRHELSGTPNHPVLTRRGWVALNELHEGDDLVSGVPVKDRVVARQPDIDRAPAVFEELYESLASSGVRQWAAGRKVDFHGDGCRSEVEIIRTQRELSFERHASLLDKKLQLFLELAADLSRFGESLGAGLQTLRYGLQTSGPAAYGVMGSGGELTSPFWSELLMAKAHRFATRSYRDTLLDKSSTKSALADAVLFGKGLDTFAGDVSFEKIVKVRRTDFSGHVFNLETGSGWYTANGIIVSNCRPPDNRKPEKQELDACFEYLVGQLRAVRPKIIVALGGSAVAAFFGGKPEISKLRGKWQEWEGIPVMPTYHPSYLKRNESSPEFIELKKQVWSDMQQVLHKLGRS